MLTKKKIQKQIAEMPNEFSFDELFDRLVLLNKIDEGLDDLRSGRTISHEEMKKEMTMWFK